MTARPYSADVQIRKATTIAVVLLAAIAGIGSYRHMHELALLHLTPSTRAADDGADSHGRLAHGHRALRLQREAWQWAVADHALKGNLPSGKEIRERFGRSERWGRLVSQAGRTGRLEVSTSIARRHAGGSVHSSGPGSSPRRHLVASGETTHKTTCEES